MNYDNPFYWDNVYGHALRLLQGVLVAGTAGEAVHLDIGCGFGRIAEPLRQLLGLTYLGVDQDEEALASLRQRGFEATAAVFGTPAEIVAALDRVIAGRRVASITIIDVLEHLADPQAMLQVIAEIARRHQAAVVVSVPNGAHRDVGFKLAFGRYDETDTGLLDHTHLQVFTEHRLLALLRSVGLHQIGQADVLAEKSDQHFPQAHPALADASLLRQMLAGLRQGVDGMATVNQIVRLCLPGPAVPLPPREREPQRPFLSIVTRTQARRLDTLRDLLLCLTAQTDEDFEVVIVGHRLEPEAQRKIERLIDDTPLWIKRKLRLELVSHGNRTVPLNHGFGVARGQYIAIMDDDDAPFAHWVETFRELAGKGPGTVLRAVAVRQDVVEVTPQNGSKAIRAVGGCDKLYPSHFSLLEHLRVNQTPPMALAFPRGVFHELGIRFDEQLTTTEDWDYLLRCATVCGVTSSPEISSLYRWWKDAESSRSVHSQSEWRHNHERIQAKLDAQPALVPAGFFSSLIKMLENRDYLEKELSRGGRGSVTAAAGRPVRTPPMHRKGRIGTALRAQLNRSDGGLLLFWWLLSLRLLRSPKRYLRLYADYRRIATSGLFDREWYCLQNEDVWNQQANPILHYLQHGAAEGRNPHPLFDGNWYLDQNPDVRGLGVNPLLHYLRWGAREGRNPNPWFDSGWYARTSPGANDGALGAFGHYLTVGARAGRSPGPRFDVTRYLSEHPDVVESGMNPLLHYLRHGQFEGRSISPVESAD